MLSGLLAGRKIAPLAKPQHHVEKAEIRTSVGDGVVLATDGANPNAAEGKDAGLDRGLADHFDNLSYIDAGIEVGGIFQGKMRHIGITPAILRGVSSVVTADRAIAPWSV